MEKTNYDVDGLFDSIKELADLPEEDREIAITMLAYALNAMSHSLNAMSDVFDEEFDVAEFLQMAVDRGTEEGIDVKPFTDKILETISEINGKHDDDKDETTLTAEAFGSAIGQGLSALLEGLSEAFCSDDVPSDEVESDESTKSAKQPESEEPKVEAEEPKAEEAETEGTEAEKDKSDAEDLTLEDIGTELGKAFSGLITGFFGAFLGDDDKKED